MIYSNAKCGGGKGDNVVEGIWREALLSVDATVHQAIHCLDKTAMKIVMAIGEEGVFEGTISDGDIRRGLLRGLDMDSSISNIVNRNAIVVPPGLTREMVLQLMVANKIHQIPIVDERHLPAGLHFWDEIMMPHMRPNMMVIMAGGMGTRLLPHTESIPKPLLSVAGKPMLEHIIERSRLEGFNHFVLAIGYLGHMIENHFGDGRHLGVNIDYLREDSPLGTAGALGLFSHMPDTPFVVTNGDVITDIRYGELLDFHIRQNATATMAVRLHEWQHPFGVVQTQGIEITGFEEKPVSRSYINAGVYALSPSALNVLVEHDPCDMPTLFERLRSRAESIVAYPMHEPWLDVGRPDDLARAQLALAHTIL